MAAKFIPKLQLQQHRREQLPLDPEMPLFGIGRFVLEPMAGHARIRRNQLRRRHRLDWDNRRKRVGDRPHAAEVERVGLVLHVLGNDERPAAYGLGK